MGIRSAVVKGGHGGSSWILPDLEYIGFLMYFNQLHRQQRLRIAMHLIIILVTSILFLTLGVNAARLVIYTSVAKPLTLVTLKKDWTLDTTSKAENLVRWP